MALLPSDIRPFSKSPTCPKCLSTKIKSELRRKGSHYVLTYEQEDLMVDWGHVGDVYNEPEEHLFRICDCKYCWLEWPADKLVIVVGKTHKVTEADLPLNRFERVSK